MRLVIAVKCCLLACGLVACCAATSWTAERAGDAQHAVPAREADAEYERLRGLEQVPKEGSAWNAVAGAVLLVPRAVLDALTYSMAFGAYVGAETSVPERLEEALTFYDHRIGVHPLLSLSSGSRTEYGAEVAYRQQPFGAALSGLYGDRSNWGTKLDLVTEFTHWKTPFKIRGTAFVNERDDYRFYGFGPSPESDPRNHFQPGAPADYGIYAQRLERVSLAATARRRTHWQFFLVALYQQRKVRDPEGSDPANISDTFEPGSVPGTNLEQRQIYEEVGFRFDTRPHDRKISPGFRLEAYAGFANAVGDDTGRFRRLGVDVAPYLPVLGHDRLIVPRFILDTVDDLNEDVPLAFTDYPRQPAFRGASRTYLLRTDEFSAVPSLEYQWPLTHNVSGHLFIDYLMVADSLRHLTFADAPYAYGVGIAIQTVSSELGRVMLSSGSEGVRLMIDLGLSGHLSDRTRWQ